MYKIAILFFFLLLAVSAKAHTPDNPQLLQFNIENGLPSNHVYSVVQDRQGYIWILTDNGIVKYNGYTFTLFNTANGLPSNDVWYLTEDSRGRIWLHTYAEELGYIREGAYHRVELPIEGTVKILRIVEREGLLVLKLAGDAKGAFISIDENDGVTELDIAEDYDLYSLQDPIVYRLPYNAKCVVGQVQMRPTGAKAMAGCNTQIPYLLYFNLATMDYGGLFYKTGTKQFALADFLNCSLQKKSLTQYGASKDEEIFLVYSASRRYHIITDKSVYILDSTAALKKKVDYRKFLPRSQVTFYYETPDGNAWFTTRSEGLFLKYNIRNSFHYTPGLSQILDEAGLVGQWGNDTCWWFHEESQMVYGIHRKGQVFFARQMKQPVKNVFKHPGGFACFVLPESVQYLDPKTGAFRNILDSKKPFFTEDFLPGDYSSYLKRRSDDLEEFADQVKPTILRQFDKLHAYRSGKLYGISHNGLRVIDSDSDRVFIKTLSTTKFSNILFDSLRNRYWAFSRSSILVLNPETDSFKTISRGVLRAFGLKTIRDLALDRFSNVYVLDGSGITVFNTINGAFRSLSVSVNLIDAQMQVFGDKIFIAGKFGIISAGITGPLGVSQFGIVTNVNAAYYNRAHDFFVSRGLVLLNTDKGVFTLAHDAFSYRQMQQVAAQQAVVVNDPYRAVLKENETLVLPAGSRNLSLGYINYFGKGEPGFSCSIVDAPEAATQQGRSGELYSVDLVPGKSYAVKCIAGDEFWQSLERTFYITVAPFWWQTNLWKWIFWLGGGGLLAVVVLLAVLVTRSVVARSNEKKRARVELELRAIYAQINPHFIFNTLSSALHSISKRDFDEAYSNVSKFSKLLRAYLKSSRSRYSLLSEELNMLTHYVELQKTRFQNKFDYSIEVDNKVPAQHVQIPSLLLQPLVENAINHGLFHKGGGGLLSLKFLQGNSSEELICIIEDNGVGRKRSKELNNESIVLKESYGNKLTEELIILFRKYEGMDILVDYTDKELPETGTIVKLTIRNLKYVA